MPHQSKSAHLKSLRENLACHQMQARIEERWLAASRAKCAQIEAEILTLEHPESVTVPEKHPTPFETSSLTQAEMEM